MAFLSRKNWYFLTSINLEHSSVEVARPVRDEHRVLMCVYETAFPQDPDLRTQLIDAFNAGERVMCMLNREGRVVSIRLV